MILNRYKPDSFAVEPFVAAPGRCHSTSSASTKCSPAEGPAKEFVIWVKPSEPIPQQIVDLSVIDQIVVRCWSSYVLCFPMPDRTTTTEIFDYLKWGLQRTADQFPFILGSLQPKRDAKAGSLEVSVGPESAIQFGFRDITQTCDMTFERLRQYDFPPAMVESEELSIGPPPESINSASYNPVFLAQATFMQGGVILFFAHSHQIADVTGTSSFMRTWSQNVSAAATGHTASLSEPLRRASLIDDRRRLSNGDTVDHSISHSCFPMTIEDTPPPSPKQRHMKLEQNPSLIWCISAAKLQELKELARPSNGEAYISTLDAVNALFWRVICRSRRLSENNVSETKMYFVCDIRGKLSPPLRPDSTCNATMKLHATQACENIQGDDLQSSLRPAAAAIRQAIREFSPSLFETWVNYVKSAPSFWSLKAKERLQEGPDIVVTDHSKVSAYQYVWGPLGNIERIRNPWWARSTPKPFSQVTLMPRLPDNSLEILTNMSTDINTCLLADEELAQFASIRC